MKRLVLSLLFSFGCFFLFAESVSKEEVHRQAVAACMHIAEDDFSKKPYTITPMLQGEDTCYYVVQFEPKGYALISSDDRLQPVIGYSTTDVFNWDRLPEPMRISLEERSIKIKRVKSTGINLKRHLGWLSHSLRSSNKKEGYIAPLIKVHWAQDGDFAKYCPVNNKGEKTLVGCVAVAMAQAMTVTQYPLRPKGEISYDNASDEVGRITINFDEELAYDWDKIMSGADDYDEVARFLYHCGVSLKSRYRVSGTGALGEDVPEALISQFSYNADSVKFYQKRQHFNWTENSVTVKIISDEKWKSIIINELKQGRAIMHNLGSFGHMLNIDGFDGVNAFHFEWGQYARDINVYYTLEETIGDEYYKEYYIKMITGFVPVEQSATSIESVAKSLEHPIQVFGSLLRLKSPEKGICRIYNMSGVLLQTVPIVAGETEISLKTTGICVLSVDCNGKVASHKIHIRE